MVGEYGLLSINLFMQQHVISTANIFACYTFCAFLLPDDLFGTVGTFFISKKEPQLLDFDLTTLKHHCRFKKKKKLK